MLIPVAYFVRLWLLEKPNNLILALGKYSKVPFLGEIVFEGWRKPWNKTCYNRLTSWLFFFQKAYSTWNLLLHETFSDIIPSSTINYTSHFKQMNLTIYIFHLSFSTPAMILKVSSSKSLDLQRVELHPF